jgi:hypothetical protein
MEMDLIRILEKMLDPDPDPHKINADLKPR